MDEHEHRSGPGGPGGRNRPDDPGAEVSRVEWRDESQRRREARRQAFADIDRERRAQKAEAHRQADDRNRERRRRNRRAVKVALAAIAAALIALLTWWLLS